MPGASPLREPVQENPVPLPEAVQHQRPSMRLVSGGAGGELKSATSLEPGEMLQFCSGLGGPGLPLEYRTWTKHLRVKSSWGLCHIVSAEGTAHWDLHCPRAGKRAGPPMFSAG